MKKLLIFCSIFLLAGPVFSAQVVQRISDGKYVYRESPDFAKGYGIKNAVAMYGGKAEDYKEITITEAQWTTQYNASLSTEKSEKEIIAELQAKIATLESKVSTLEAR